MSLYDCRACGVRFCIVASLSSCCIHSLYKTHTGSKKIWFGATSRGRTCALVFTKHSLCRLSYSSVLPVGRLRSDPLTRGGGRLLSQGALRLGDTRLGVI